MGLSRTSLRRLHVLEAVARHRSVSRAAAELHLTQPAVSMQLRQLEAECGVALLEQMGRRLDLTPAGREVLECARAVIARLRDTGEALEALKGGAGELSIAAVSTAKYHVPKLLAEFRRQHPRVRVRLSISNREAVVRELTENTVDLAVMGTPPRGLDTVAQPFAEHPLAFIAAPDHPLAGRKRLPLARLAGETFLIREPGSGTRGAMERFFAAHRFRPHDTIEMSSNETLKQAVMAGLGVSFLSLHTAGLELAARRLAVLPVSGTPIMRAWHVVHREKKRLAPVAQAFKAFLVEHGARAIEQALG